MRYKLKAILQALSALMICLVITLPLAAKDYFLTIGGGYDPTGNQVSLESNVLLLQRVLADQRPDLPQHDIYFSDGDDPQRDLQYIDDEKAKQCSAAQRIMTELFGRSSSLGRSFRTSQVPNVSGPTEPVVIKRRIREISRELKRGDRLIIYVTSHGGEGETESDDEYDYEYDYDEKKWKATYTDNEEDVFEVSQFNTSLYLWGKESITAREFGRWLDQISPEVTVIMVMVQCYSGGFAHTLFKRHDPELGLSTARRCGFFSQVHDRAAAGCNANSNESSYQEYSTYFWAALGGKSRSGESIEVPDYDQDGQISLAEAHAYVVIESDTIDIPIRTSGAFLRQYSRLGKQAATESEDEESTNPVSRFLGALGSGKPEEAGRLANLSGPLSRLLDIATDDQCAILEALTQKVGLPKQVLLEAIRLKLHQAKSDLAAANTKSHNASEVLSDLHSELREEIYEVWPELSKGFSPIYVELASTRSKEFQETVESLATYRAWQSASQRDDELSEEVQVAARAEARVQRLIRTIENVVLAENLPKVASTEIVERYRQLITMEEQTLTEPE